LLIGFEGSLVERLQQLTVELTRLIDQGEVLENVGGEGLVQRIVAYYILVIGEEGGDLGPVSDELVLEAIDVVVEALESRDGLSCWVVESEVVLLAVLNQRVSIRIVPKAVVLDGLAYT
jgi:hypothetical protein